MAEISKIKASDGVTYDIRDTSKEPIIGSSNKVPEAFLSWGGESWSGSVSPVGVALSLEHSSNRLAFINGDALTFEYSSNGGSTWTNYNYSASDKSAFCTTNKSVPIGRPDNTTNLVANQSKSRITLTAQNGTTGYVYTSAKKMLVRVSSATTLSMLIEYRTGTNYKNGGAWTTFGTYNVSGWSGWNDVPLVLNTLGGGTTQTGNNWQLRLTFTCTTVNSSYPKTAEVMAIRIFGDNDWTSPSTMASTGHLYSFDMSKNAVFPAGVSATSFTENGTALSSKYKASGAYSRATTNTTTVASNAHTHTGPSHTHTYAKATSASFTGSSVDTGSAGGHSHTFTGTAVTSGTPSATTSVATYNHTHTGPSHTHTYAKATSASFTGSSVNSGSPTVIASGTSSSTTVVAGSLSGTVLTLTTTTVASTVHGHSVTASGSISLSHTSTNSGSGGTGATGAASASVTVASNAHTHNVTAKGTLNSTGAHTHSVTAEGEIELGYTSTNSGSGGTGATGAPSANTTVPTSGHTHGVS